MTYARDKDAACECPQRLQHCRSVRTRERNANLRLSALTGRVPPPALRVPNHAVQPPADAECARRGGGHLMRAAASELPDRPIEGAQHSPWQYVAASERLQPITASLCAKSSLWQLFRHVSRDCELAYMAYRGLDRSPGTPRTRATRLERVRASHAASELGTHAHIGISLDLTIMRSLTSS